MRNEKIVNDDTVAVVRDDAANIMSVRRRGQRSAHQPEELVAIRDHSILIDAAIADKYGLTIRIVGKGSVKHGKISIAAIEKGLAGGLVKLINNPNDGDVSCQIGEHWFYFAGITGEDISVEEYVKSVPPEDTVRAIFEAIDGLDETEQNYYAVVLQEGGVL